MRNKVLIGLILLVFSLTLLGFAKTNEWELRIGVKAGEKYRDSYNFLGVSRDSSLYYDKKDVPEPPPSPSGLSLYFSHEDWGYRAGRYATDFRQPILDKEIYEFVVEGREYTRLTLFWQDMGKVPKKYRVLLVDEKKDVSIDMRKAGEYSFASRPDIKRKFRIVVKKR